MELERWYYRIRAGLRTLFLRRRVEDELAAGDRFPPEVIRRTIGNIGSLACDEPKKGGILPASQRMIR